MNKISDDVTKSAATVPAKGLDASKTSKRQEESGTFGTFGGVVTPCTLTILGVIMFLRYGQVVGQSGLINALLIVLVAKIITVLTTLSLSAIATNTRVKGGGAYYLISRSLGVEYGGAIGLVFFLAQAISVAMYIIGFTEALLATFPTAGLSMPVVASFDDQSQVGFEVEGLDNGLVADFLPGSPDTWSGTVAYMTHLQPGLRIQLTRSK